MQNELNKVRFSVKPLKSNDNKVVELARTVGIHPLAYQELPYDPEYSFYAGRLNPEVLSHATADEMYWKVRQEVIFRHTGEHPYEISGPDAEKLLQKIFTRDISKVKVGRCSYQFACYNDGGMLTDGVLLKLEENKFWFVQADGDLFSWYKAHTDNLNVKISDPDVWVSQIQGPKSMDLLKVLSKETFPENWKYFDWKEITILNEKVIISRSGFSNELGWEIYFRKNNNTEKVGDYILEEGKKMGMILTGTPGFRCKRIESGLLSAGQDFNHETNPYDVGLGKYVDLKKNYFFEICFDKEDNFLDMYSFLKIPFFEVSKVVVLTDIFLSCKSISQSSIGPSFLFKPNRNRSSSALCSDISNVSKFLSFTPVTFLSPTISLIK